MAEEKTTMKFAVFLPLFMIPTAPFRRLIKHLTTALRRLWKTIDYRICVEDIQHLCPAYCWNGCERQDHPNFKRAFGFQTMLFVTNIVMYLLVPLNLQNYYLPT